MIFGWSPGIGDPSFLGWFTVIAYFLASLLCVMASRRDVDAKRFWSILGIALAILGVNKQLDIQSLFTVVARELANSEGWYDRRREFQKLFVFAIAFFSFFAAVSAVILLRNKSRHIRMAAAGFVLLGAFVCIRAASFHHVDSLLNAGILGARFNWIIELGGISFVGVNAFGAIQTVRRNPGSQQIAD